MKLFQRVLPRVVFLMGGPGAGKSFLATRFPSFIHVSTGQLLRNLVQQRSHPLSTFFKTLMERGDLIPDQHLIGLLEQQITNKHKQPIILDGFPRTLSQWELYKNRFGKPVKVIDLVLPREEMYQRLMARHRYDDTPGTANHRLDDYFDQVISVANIIKADCSPNTVDIDAYASPDVVQARLATALADEISSLELTNVEVPAAERRAVSI